MNFTGKIFSKETIAAIIVVLVGVGAFGLGKLSVIRNNREPLTIEYPTPYIFASTTSGTIPSVPGVPGSSPSNQGASVISSTQPATQNEPGASDGSTVAPGTSEDRPADAVVASKNSKLYHLPTCAGAKRISEKNKVWFDSPEAARAAGLSPATSCKGLK